MPHPPSPHQELSEELSGCFGIVDGSKYPLCAPIPLHPPAPLPSVSPNTPATGASSMAASFPEQATSRNGLPAFTIAPVSRPMHWDSQHDIGSLHMGVDSGSFGVSNQYPAHPSVAYDYDCNNLSYNHNYDLAYTTPTSSSCPRSYTNGLEFTALPLTIQDAYPPAAYQIEPQRPHEAVDLADQGINNQLIQIREEYEPYSPASHVDDYGGYGTPYESDITPSSTPAGDPPMLLPSIKSKYTGDEGAIDKEQPYAQLIFRALKEAPNHTMILRDIYDWFKRNTDKANNTEAKGWQNSIRHNLSMNGAFEKVDHSNSDDSKKGFMWRLTDEAIRNGVKSTTRYRSKHPHKRAYRSHHPLPQRQASGAKGGQASRRAARVRRSYRSELACNEQPMSRSVPYNFDPYCEPPTTLPCTVLPFYTSADTSIPAAAYPDYGALGFGAPDPHMELFASRSFAGTPFSQQSTACDDTAHIELPLNPADPLFAPSPSPTADEPRTPDEHTPGWPGDMALAEGPGMYYDMPYSEY